MSRKLLCIAMLLLVCLMCAPVCVQAEGTPRLVPITIEDQGGKVVYPRLDGHPDALVQTLVNQAIVEECGIQTLLESVSSPFAQVQSDYEATLMGDVLSIVVSAVEDGKQSYATVSIDLQTGQKILLDQLFTNVEAAIAQMEAICQERVEPNVSSYLESGQVLPLPLNEFYLTGEDITFYYPADQFSYFSGYCGSVTFFYYELKEHLDTSATGLLAALGALEDLTVKANTKERIVETVAAGCLPGIAPQLGDPLMPWLEKYRLLSDPDYYPGGRFFQMEAGQMRDVWLLTDALTDDYHNSLVLGLRADRVNLFGVQPGVTLREECTALLGQPGSSVSLNDYDAADYLLPAGVSDYYTFGENMLRLHYDEEGLLVSVQVLK